MGNVRQGDVWLSFVLSGYIRIWPVYVLCKDPNCSMDKDHFQMSSHFESQLTN